MAERNWTDEQKAAISCDAGDILVSAGAGSGKTAVLTERIIRRLSDPDNPADITRLLIVTFTNAATAELRERIGQALRARLAADPGNRRLRRQLLLLPSARIDTISSFCLGIVRSNLSALGLPAGLRVCDETESALLAEEVMDRVIDGFYEGEYGGVENFGEFCDAFVSDRDDRLNELFLDLYRKLINYTEGVGLLEKNARELSAAAGGGADFMSTPWGQSISAELRSRLDYFIAVFERASEYFTCEPAVAKAYSAQFALDLEFARELRARLDGGAYAELRAYIESYKPERLGSLRKFEAPAELDFYKKNRASFASSAGFVRKIYKDYFAIDEALLRSVLGDCASQCETFYAVLSAFDERFAAEKRRRAVADYGDLERFAYKLLYNADGSVSDGARAAAAEFDEIYVDEYQDVNELQDLIFAALAKAPAAPGAHGPRVRFMVGDVKQSIYGFRGAAPALFASYRSDPAVETLYLRTNFRSDGRIIDFVNRVSGYIFTGTGSEVDYGDGDKLIRGKESGGEAQRVRVILFDGREEESDGSDSDDGGEPSEPDELEIGEKLIDAPPVFGEPEFVADEIARLVGAGLYKPGEIAILLRGASGRSKVYEEALRRRAVGVSGGGSDFFAQPEVLATICILNCVNNPSRDIYLAGALRSPFFGFTFDDLLRVRRFVPSGAAPDDDDDVPFYLGDIAAEGASGDMPANNAAESDGDNLIGAENTPARDRRACSLYEALRFYTEQTGFEKGRRFLDRLADYRAYAEGNPADRVVRYIYRDTAVTAFAAGGGGTQSELVARRRNLTRLYELARTFENGQFRGLGDFLEFLDRLSERGDAPFSEVGGESDRVRIMSIHKSKGLEFPVCFVCDCARGFNRSDAGRTVLFDPHLGASAKLGDKSGFGRIDTPVRTAAALSITRRMKYEEMRALYVAMTRARERLYLTATLAAPDALIEKAALTSEVLPPGARGAEVIAKNNFIGWIANALAGKSDGSAELEIFTSDAGYNAETETAPIVDTAPIANDSPRESEPLCAADPPDGGETVRLSSIFGARLNFSYRWKPLEKLPAKLSVSKLYPSILDEGDDAALDILMPGDSDEAQIDLASLIQDRAVDIKLAGRKFAPPRFLSSDPDAVTAAERGTATHIFMQFCDFSLVERFGIREELARLVNGRFMTAGHADLVDLRAVERFFGGDLYSEMRSARSLFREVRFNVRLPASEFTQNPELRALLSGEPVLVQGVVDCYYETADGALRLVDYKTDYIPPKLRGEPGKAEELLIRRHSRQLGYYAQAIEKLTSRTVASRAIYSFALGKTIYID